MSDDRRSSAPPFGIAGAVFVSWITPGGYVWRSECGRFEARRAGRQFRAGIDGIWLPGEHRTLVGAMLATVDAGRQRRSA